MKKIMLTENQVFPNGAYLAEVKERHIIKNGTWTPDVEGWNYIVASRAGFDKITVKTNDKVPKITPEQLEASEKDISVTFKGFVGKIYTINGKVGISATAEEVILQ